MRDMHAGSTPVGSADKLRRAALEGKGCEEDLRGFQFKARGNEPYWNLTIAESGIALLEMGSAPQTYPYTAPQSIAEGWLFSPTIEGMASPIQVTLRQQRCIDSMSGERFGYDAVYLGVVAGQDLFWRKVEVASIDAEKAPYLHLTARKNRQLPRFQRFKKTGADACSILDLF